ncbi:MAG: hypothetical protein GY934_17700 [Gammaproteobacteria bacterium]|nr:hypothetical protein [Gammaproteobacteria bacterium]
MSPEREGDFFQVAWKLGTHCKSMLVASAVDFGMLMLSGCCTAKAKVAAAIEKQLIMPELE